MYVIVCLCCVCVCDCVCMLCVYVCTVYCVMCMHMRYTEVYILSLVYLFLRYAIVFVTAIITQYKIIH